ncbi:MarR family winged helix-turn-helix transcriptional regulator [Neglectibacter caecimuris]|uniref:MarR family winged helix-turn-helix transcriptional regulator n=1 Tax=Neglectibacter caecimuris TaxID=3093658 RepID=UPI002AC8D067|nr:MarR family transcriptional regulator [Neglectibacter sp. M00184]
MEYPGKTEMTEIYYLNSEIDYVYHEIAVKLGLSDSELAVLSILYDFEGQCLLSDILRLSGISKQTVNSALRRLEKQGMIVLKAFAGKRKRVCLTPAGKVLADSTARRVLQLEEEIWAAWTKEERELYLELTRRYLSALKEKAKTL